MSENNIAQATTASRRTLHPLIVLAALSVIAVSVIAAIQFLQPQDAKSEGVRSGQVASTNTTKPAPGAPNSAARNPTPATVCANCGVVVAVRQSKQTGEGTGLGAVAGGVVGGVVGNQFGRGHGNEAMTVAGAVGGAVAGHQIEKHARSKVVYHVDVKMEDGTVRTFHYASAPGLAVGTRVQANGNQLVLRS